MPINPPPNESDGRLVGIEHHDVLAGLAIFSNGVLSATEHRDALTAVGSISVSASMAATERPDVFSAHGWTVDGSMSATERHDTAVMIGVSVVGTMAATERVDVFSAHGKSIAVGTGLGVENRDTLAGVGKVTARGSMAATGRNDTASLVGVFVTHAIGTLLAGGHDALAASGVYGPPGVLGATERHDIFAGLSVQSASAALSATERQDTMRSFTSGADYNIYANTGIGDPIDYTTPIAITSLLTWTSSALAYPGTWKFGVRAFDACGEEQNVDAVVVLILDASGNDITNTPNAPFGLRGFAIAGGQIKIEWSYQNALGPKGATGFHVYYGTSGTPNYSTVVATVPFGAAFAGAFTTTLTGLTGGLTYTIGVRAYNTTSEEKNTVVVKVFCDNIPPLPPVNFSGSIISES